MASLDGFNAGTTEPNGGFDAIPPGRYLAVMTESVMKPTKAGDGRYLEMTFQIIEGPYKGRNLWDRLNLENPSDMAVKIARGTLSSICRAVNVLTPKDSVDLHNLPIVVKVALNPMPDGDVGNRIKGYFPREGMTVPNVSPAPVAPKAPNVPAEAPWGRPR